MNWFMLNWFGLHSICQKENKIIELKWIGECVNKNKVYCVSKIIIFVCKWFVIKLYIINHYFEITSKVMLSNYLLQIIAVIQYELLK